MHVDDIDQTVVDFDQRVQNRPLPRDRHHLFGIVERRGRAPPFHARHVVVIDLPRMRDAPSAQRDEVMHVRRLVAAGPYRRGAAKAGVGRAIQQCFERPEAAQSGPASALCIHLLQTQDIGVDCDELRPQMLETPPEQGGFAVGGAKVLEIEGRDATSGRRRHGFPRGPRRCTAAANMAHPASTDGASRSIPIRACPEKVE